MKHSPLVYSLVLIFLFSRCDSASMDGRQYPPSKSWRLAPLAEAKFPVTVPDSINVVAYVILKSECGPHALCILPDAIYLSETIYRGDIDWDNSVRIDSRPREFRVGHQYLFSIRIRVGRSHRLEGYDWTSGSSSIY